MIGTKMEMQLHLKEMFFDRSSFSSYQKVFGWMKCSRNVCEVSSAKETFVYMEGLIRLQIPFSRL
jgi:hypothetical protein